MSKTMRRVKEIAGVTPDLIPLDALMAAQQPAVLKGLARDWPLVAEMLAEFERLICVLPEWAAGRWCDVFEIRDFLIQRVFIYLDPDYAGKDTERYPWLTT